MLMTLPFAMNHFQDRHCVESAEQLGSGLAETKKTERSQRWLSPVPTAGSNAEDILLNQVSVIRIYSNGPIPDGVLA